MRYISQKYVSLQLKFFTINKYHKGKRITFASKYFNFHFSAQGATEIGRISLLFSQIGQIVIMQIYNGLSSPARKPSMPDNRPFRRCIDYTQLCQSCLTLQLLSSRDKSHWISLAIPSRIPFLGGRNFFPEWRITYLQALYAKGETG